MAGLVLNSTAVILLNFCAKPNICPSISATSPSCKTLYVTLNEHSVHIQTPKTLPCYPTLFLAHCKAHKTQTQTKPCKELKMPTHNPPTPADEYLSSFAQHIGNKTLLTNLAHPPPDYLILISLTQPVSNLCST